MDESAARRPGLDADGLYRQLQPALLAVLRRHHAGQAEDIAADVWAEAVALLPRFEGDGDAFRAWLFTLARRRLIDAYRRSGRRPTEPLDGDVAATLTDDPEHHAIERVDLATAIDGLYDLLPADQADVVVLRIVGGLSVPTVALLLGKQPGHVRVLQHRALRRLSLRYGAVRRPA